MHRRLILAGGGAAAAALCLGLPRAARAASISGVYSAPGITYAGFYLAAADGSWKKYGLEPEVKRVQGGPLAMAALTNGDASFAGVASTDPVIGWDKGIRTLTVAAFTGSLAMQFSAHDDWLAKAGVSPATPMDAKLKALKGARIGVSTVGGGPAQYTRYILRQAGLDPEADAQLLAVGFGASRIAALRSKQVDVTVGDAPEADQIEAERFGKLYVDCGRDLPTFAEFPYTVLSVTSRFAKDEPDAVRRIVHALVEGNDLFRTNLGKVIDVMRGVYPTIDGKVLERSLARAAGAFPSSGRMTERMWANMNEVSTKLKMIKAPIPVAEGDFWTNRFQT